MKNTEQKIPALRFPEFSGEWESCVWGDVLIGFSSGATPYRGTPDYFKGNNLWVSSGELKYNVILDTVEKITDEAIQDTRLKVHPKGTFLMAITGLEAAGTRGSCALLGVSATTNQSCMAFYPSPKVENLFLFYFYQKVGQQYAFRYCQGTKQQSYTAEIAKILPISFPSLPEQQKIADFLSVVDKRLQLLKDKKTKIEEYKRGVMQRIFSQELRFTRPDGSAYPDWKEKRLGEINIILSDGNYGELYPKSSEMLEQGIPFIRANNIKDQKIVWDDMKFISEEQHMILTSGHLEEEDVLITTRGDIGNVALTPREFHGANINAQICLIRIKNKEKVNAKFLLQFLQIFNSRKQLKQLETGSALKQLPKGNLLQLLINLPHIDEQCQIADFLSVFDDKISLLSKQIQSTEQYKKGLLQQMFV